MKTFARKGSSSTVQTLYLCEVSTIKVVYVYLFGRIQIYLAPHTPPGGRKELAKNGSPLRPGSLLCSWLLDCDWDWGEERDCNIGSDDFIFHTLNPKKNFPYKVDHGFIMYNSSVSLCAHVIVTMLFHIR